MKLYLNYHPMISQSMQEDEIDLLTTIKAAIFYRRSKQPDYVLDYIPPTPSEFKKIVESNQ